MNIQRFIELFENENFDAFTDEFIVQKNIKTFNDFLTYYNSDFEKYPKWNEICHEIENWFSNWEFAESEKYAIAHDPCCRIWDEGRCNIVDLVGDPKCYNCEFCKF